MTGETRNFEIWDNLTKKKYDIETNKKGKEWVGFCPLHDDRKTPNLHINAEEKVWFCFVCYRGGSLFNPDFKKTDKRIKAIYGYANENGKLICKKYRIEKTDDHGHKKKEFPFKSLNKNDNWVWGLAGLEPPLYNLPKLIKNRGQPIFILEGEKDVINAEKKLGILAVSVPFGAGPGKWKPQYNEYFRDMDVIIIPDNEVIGKEFAQEIASALKWIAKSVKIIELPGLEEHGDLSDFIEKNKVKTLENLFMLVKNASEFKPIPVTKGIPYVEKEIEEISQKKLDELLEKAIPDHGFLRDYIDAFSEVTDTPRAFLFWGAMTLVSTVLGKGVWIEWEARNLYPNIWCVFLAPSGFRKGTGIDLPVKLIWDFNSDLLLPCMGSEEGLTKALDIKRGGHSVGFIRWQEFVKILKSWNTKGSWIANQEFFIDIWDGKPFKKKLSQEEFNIEETAINFLAGCTPSSFSNYFRREDLEGGFFGRIYLIACKEKEKYIIIPPAVNKLIFNDLLLKLKKIDEGKFSGPISYENIKTDFESWARRMHDKKEKGFMDSFYPRIETHCMKLMLIYQASLDQQDTILGKEAFIYAINAIDFLLTSARLMVTEEIGLSEEQKQTLRIRNYIRVRKMVSRREVYRTFHLSKKDMTEVENTLKDAGYIQADINYPTTGAGAPCTMYTAI